MLIYATYALSGKGYLFQKVTFTKIFKTLRFVYVAGQGERTPGGCCATATSRVSGNMPHQAALQQGDLHPTISLPANKAVAAQK